MGYSRGVYTNRDFLPVLLRPEAGSSRELDPTGRFVVDPTTGGFSRMDDVAQRVTLLLAFNVPEFGGFSTDAARATWRARAFKALEPLTRSKPPVIRDLRIVVESDGPGRNEATVTYIVVSTGQEDTVTL